MPGGKSIFASTPTKTAEFEVKKRGRSKSRTLLFVTFVIFRNDITRETAVTKLYQYSEYQRGVPGVEPPAAGGSDAAVIFKVFF